MTPRRAPWSLRARLLLIAVLACLCTLLAGLAAMVGAAERASSTLQEQRLRELAEAVRAIAEMAAAITRGDGPTRLIRADTLSEPQSRYRYQVWTAHGNLLLRDELSPTVPLMPLGQMGFRTVRLDGAEIRVLSLRSSDGHEVIQVGEYVDDRDAGVWLMGRYFLALVIPPFIAVVAVTAWLLRRSLRALDASAALLGARSPLDLTPVHVADPPAELRPMLASINSLFARITEAMSLERGFTAVAAHELRTPLAGLRAQAQIAATARSRQESEEALAAVMAGVDRAAHLLEQLLDLTRIESIAGQGGSPHEDLEVADVYGQVMADLDALATRRSLQLQCDFAAPRIRALPLGLTLLMSNLIGNALRYTPPGGRVRVSTHAESDAVVLTVDDTGPGIPAASRQRVFERFERLGTRDGDGVGLGMSIVRSVALAHRADIRLLDSPWGGLRVEVRFPAATGSFG